VITPPPRTRTPARIEPLEGRVLFAAGDLDPTFGGGDGIASPDSSDPFDSTQAMAVAGDGSIVAVGRTNTPPDGFSVVVTRYHPDGTPDASFGGDGDGDARSVVDVVGEPARAVVDAGGRTVVAIRTGFLGDAGIDVVRLKQDGSLDAAFGEGGKARAFFGHATDVTALKVEDDGKVVLGVIVFAPVPDPSEGSVRFNADGSMDESYTGGVVAKDDGGLGEIGAYDFRVRDESQPGAVHSARVQSPALAAARQPDGKIVALDEAVVEGQNLRPVAVLRFNADGTVDPTFAHAAHPGGSSGTIAVQPGTGRILYGGPHLAVIGLQSAPPLAEPREVPPPEPARDTSPPTATLVAPPDVTAATTSGIEFVVRYADDTAVDLSSFDGNDVRVTAPDGSSAAAEKVGGPTATRPNEFSVTYRYTPAAGGFDADSNGTYAVSVAPNQVRDAAGNSAAAATLGGFEVNIPADAPNLTVREFFFRRRGRVPESLVAGGRARGVALVAIGNTGARRFVGNVTVRLLASADQTLDAADTVLARVVRRLAIGPGSTRHVRLPLRRIPASIPAGDFHLLAQVDDANAAAETSELDNVTASVGTTRVIARRAAARRRAGNELFVTAPLLPT
jgi:uncharacterized delta-60 repeat protein